MDESTLLYQEGGPDGDRDGRQVVLQLPEGCDTTEGVIMQIQGDNIHIITQGCELGDIPLGIAMESDRLMASRSAVAGPSQLAIGDSAAELSVAQRGRQLTVVDDEEDDEVDEVEEVDDEVEEVDEVEEPPPGGSGQLKAGTQTMAEKEEQGSVCFVCSAPCRRPCRLLLTRAASSGVSLAERLASLLPLRLHCSATDGLCDDCRQLVEQADQHHTQLKSVELRVRQLFCLEERLEEEERRQEQEQEEARLRQETLDRRRQDERRRQQEHQEDAERRRRAIERRLKTVVGWTAAGGTEPFPFAADDDFDSGDEAAAADPEETEAAPPPPPPPPPPPVDDLQDEDWTPRKRYSSRRRRQPRRPWSPDGPGPGSRSRRETPREAAEEEEGEEEPSEEQRMGADPAPGGTTTEDQVDERSEAMKDQPDQSRDPDGVPTTTIEFVSFNTPQRRGRGQHRLLNLGGGGQGRQRVRPPNTPNFYCRRCDTSFDSSGSLVEHITTSHTRPWCRRCRSEFDSVTLLNQHRRHCRSQCNLCGLRPANMAQHLRNKHPRSAEAPVAADGEWTDGDQRRSRSGGRRRPAAPAPAPAGPPTVIEFRDVKTLREQVKDVKTPRFSLKFRRASTSDLEKIQHLSVGGGRLAEAAGGSRPATARLHTCQRCGEQLDSLKEQVEHLHTVHKGKSWCRRCKTEFPNKRANLEHRADCIRQNYEGDCTRCGKHVKYLKLHMKTHEPSNKRRRESVVGPDGKLVSASLTGGECHICNKFISHRLKRHIASHVQHPCPICKKLFSREDVIAGHIKRVHMKERPHICNHCGKGFVSLYSMQRHEMIHTNSYRFYCQECGDGFRQKQQLTTHMRHKHGVVEIEFEDVRESAILGAITDGNLAADVRFYCQECGSGFHSRRILTAHMRIKHGVANVVFEDVQLHVASTIEQLGAVTVAAEEAPDQPEEPEPAAVAVDQLTGRDGDPTEPGGTADGRRDWWDPDRTTEAY